MVITNKKLSLLLLVGLLASAPTFATSDSEDSDSTTTTTTTTTTASPTISRRASQPTSTTSVSSQPTSAPTATSVSSQPTSPAPVSSEESKAKNFCKAVNGFFQDAIGKTAKLEKVWEMSVDQACASVGGRRVAAYIPVWILTPLRRVTPVAFACGLLYAIKPTREAAKKAIKYVKDKINGEDEEDDVEIGYDEIGE